jgi:putative DNA primase/helicase
MPDTKFKNRIGEKFASILFGAHYANEFLGLEISLNKVAEFLIEQEIDSMEERELAPKFYEGLKDIIIQEKRKFKIDGKDTEGYQEIWGKIENRNGKTHCYILNHIFKDIVKKLGFADSNVLLGELKKLGFLYHESDKYQIRKSVFSNVDEELEIRREMLGDKKFSTKGDRTICVLYDEDFLEAFFKEKEANDRRRNFDSNCFNKNKMNSSLEESKSRTVDIFGEEEDDAK